MAERLTDKLLSSLKPDPSKQFDVWDSTVTGLGLRVSPGGAKSFVLIYRLGTRSRRMTLGRYPILKLKDARNIARGHLQTASKGGDPAEEKKRQLRNSLAFNEYVQTFVETYAKPRNRTWKETETILNREFVSKWRKRNIRSIEKADVTHILDALVSRGKITSANRAFAQIRKLFNWAVERGDLEHSPCQGLRSPGKYRSRERVLSDAEINAVWNAADEMGYPFGAVIKLLFLTGQRLNEVASLKWSEIDLDEATWTLPADRNKSTREHIIPLSPQAVDVLKTVPKTQSEFLFPAHGAPHNPISGFSKWKEKLHQLSATSDWTLHDIRRTVSTGMAKLGVPPHVTERVLNHKTGTLGGVAGVYNRFGYLPEMCAALDQWAGHIDELR